MRNRIMIGLAVGLWLAGAAQGQPVGGAEAQGLADARTAQSASGRVTWYRGEYVTCSEKPSTVEIVACINDLTRHWDRRLNAAYSALMGDQSPEQKTRLQAAQREWLQYRNANCDYYLNSGGTIANVKFAECLRVMTAQRAIELETAAQP